MIYRVYLFRLSTSIVLCWYFEQN